LPPHRRASRLEAFLQEHIKIVRLPELLGEPFQSPLNTRLLCLIVSLDFGRFFFA